MQREVLTWIDVEAIIDHLIPQFNVEFDAMVIITCGGVIPGGLLAEALNLAQIMTASVDFPCDGKITPESEMNRLTAWPNYLQFPADSLLLGKRILIVDDVWGSGRTINAVKNRIAAAGGLPYTCVLHYNPHRSLFKPAEPDFYAATTDAFIIYPWEISRGITRMRLGDY